MELLVDQISKLQILNQFWLTFFLLIPIVLIARTVVAGTRYSPILIIVVFGLTMGLLLNLSKVSTPGLPEFPMINLVSKVTIIALIVSFFVGGQKLKRLITGKKLSVEDLVIPSQEEVLLGTRRTQLVFIIRALFILLGIEGIRRIFLGSPPDDPLGNYYPLVAYIGIMASIIFIDYKAIIKNKPVYIKKGILEIIVITAILVSIHYISLWIKPIIPLPQIFFAMIISSSLGWIFSNWQAGPTNRALLFAGIPVVLAANFLIGGSRILDALNLTTMKAVMGYGFFGQIFWMFGGLALLIFLGQANNVRNLAPGMAGSLSHAGLTGACTSGDLGQQAQARGPIMINIPFFGHLFVFTILAISAQKGVLLLPWALLIACLGIGITAISLNNLKKANGEEDKEVKGLMQFSFGWQLVAVFGSFIMLHFSGMPVSNAAMATSSSISHFGLFAALQGGMFGKEAAELIPFVFAMPFLVHPLVFGLFGKAMENDGVMPAKYVFILALMGIIGVFYSLVIL